MNLAMEKETIDQLGEYGRQAGRMLVERFDFDEHRWRRAVSFLPKLEAALEDMATTYRATPAGGGLTYETLLTDYKPRSYNRNSRRWREEVLAPFATSLAEIGDRAIAAGDDTVQKGEVPRADSNLRLVAGSDRVPAREGEAAT